MRREWTCGVWTWSARNSAHRITMAAALASSPEVGSCTKRSHRKQSLTTKYIYQPIKENHFFPAREPWSRKLVPGWSSDRHFGYWNCLAEFSKRERNASDCAHSQLDTSTHADQAGGGPSVWAYYGKEDSSRCDSHP